MNKRFRYYDVQQNIKFLTHTMIATCRKRSMSSVTSQFQMIGSPAKLRSVTHKKLKEIFTSWHKADFQYQKEITKDIKKYKCHVMKIAPQRILYGREDILYLNDESRLLKRPWIYLCKWWPSTLSASLALKKEDPNAKWNEKMVGNGTGNILSTGLVCQKIYVDILVWYTELLTTRIFAMKWCIQSRLTDSDNNCIWEFHFDVLMKLPITNNR